MPVPLRDDRNRHGARRVLRRRLHDPGHPRDLRRGALRAGDAAVPHDRRGHRRALPAGHAGDARPRHRARGQRRHEGRVVGGLRDRHRRHGYRRLLGDQERARAVLRRQQGRGARDRPGARGGRGAQAARRVVPRVQALPGVARGARAALPYCAGRAGADAVFRCRRGRPAVHRQRAGQGRRSLRHRREVGRTSREQAVDAGRLGDGLRGPVDGWQPRGARRRSHLARAALRGDRGRDREAVPAVRRRRRRHGRGRRRHRRGRAAGLQVPVRAPGRRGSRAPRVPRTLTSEAWAAGARWGAT